LVFTDSLFDVQH